MRWTASQLSTRRLLHLVVVVAFLFLCSGTPEEPLRTPLISGVHAVTHPQLPSTQPVPSVESELDLPLRREVPTATPTQLPTPLPVDPDATPLPAPTATPAPATPEPTVAPRPVASRGFLWPVAGTISQFYSIGHPALDIAASHGSAVVALQSGVVTWAGWRNNGGGFVVEIDHGDGFVSGYNHLSEIWVAAGQWASQGQPIAAIGCTGWCTGPHLHLTLTFNGILVDPLGYL